MTLEEKYTILLNTVQVIGSYEYCDCGCPNNRSARIGGTPAQVWALANCALKEIGEEIKVYENSTD